MNIPRLLFTTNTTTKFSLELPPFHLQSKNCLNLVYFKHEAIHRLKFISLGKKMQ